MGGSTTTASSDSPQFCLDEKWKLSKKDGLSRSRYSSSSYRNPSKRKCFCFSRKCAALIKEQRARFYIMRRCVTLLICWREYSE